MRQRKNLNGRLSGPDESPKKLKLLPPPSETSEPFSESENARFLLMGAIKYWLKCKECPLSRTRTKVVYGQGNPKADLLIVGEAPGETEDATGLPFVGEAGKILRKALKKANIPKDRYFISNRLGCRPENNRKPLKYELEKCEPRLVQLAEILKPKVIVLLGATAGSWGGVTEIGKNRGKLKRKHWPHIGQAKPVLKAVVLTYHPSWVLRQGGAQRRRGAFSLLLHDLKTARKILMKYEAKS